MKKISSSMTFVNKRLFPLLWFGLLTVFVLVGAQQDLAFAVFPIFMAVFGFFLMKRLVWDLVDEVYDCGTYLLIRNRDEEDAVPFTNIMNVSVSAQQRPPRITLRLITPGKFGNEIAFSPATQFSLNPFAKNQVAEDLILRVHEERSKRLP